MRSRFATVLMAVGAALPAAAQQNPFKLPKMNLKGQVDYVLEGDQKGTSTSAFDGERMMTRSSSTTKMMGKETKVSSWTLVTPDSMYTADLLEKKGTQSPNILPLMARAYDDLDGAAKQRLHSNMEGMTTMLSQIFGSGSLGSLGEKTGELTVAGEVCEDRKFGSFEVCTMKRGPRVPLKTSADFLCFRFAETATSVSLAAPPATAFEKPADVVFQGGQANADSMSRAFVAYLSSQELADSLAAAKAKLQEAQAKAPPAENQQTEMTPEQKQEAKAACEMIKNFDLNKVLADIGKAMVAEVKQAAVESAKKTATNKLKGLLKKPKIP